MGISHYLDDMSHGNAKMAARRIAAADPPAARVGADPCNNSALRKATRHLGQLFDDIVGPSGLRAAQHGLLYCIRAMRGPTMNELARFLVMDLSALGQTLKPLVRDGFVALDVDRRDKRAKRVRLTSGGERKLGETTELWGVAQSRFETAMGPDRARQLRDMLAVVASKDFGDAFRSQTPLAARAAAPNPGVGVDSDECRRLHPAAPRPYLSSGVSSK